MTAWSYMTLIKDVFKVVWGMMTFGLLPALFIDCADGNSSIWLNKFAGNLQLLFKDRARRIRIVPLQSFKGFLSFLWHIEPDIEVLISLYYLGTLNRKSCKNNSVT